MRRFYVPGEIQGVVVSISDTSQLHHLKDVLRLKVGDEVVVFDGAGNECYCVISTLDKAQAVLTVKERKLAVRKTTRITIACAIPKNTRMDDIVDGLTQVGVDAIIPMQTERVIVRLEDSKKESRLARWRRLAESAAQQSQRSTVPEVRPVTSIQEVIAGSSGFELKLIPTLAGNRRALRDAVAESEAANIIALIGPEGDFTPEEVELAVQAGFVPVSLGDSVLRVATAALAVASYIRLSVDARTFTG